jgi:hypothetical protein
LPPLQGSGRGTSWPVKTPAVHIGGPHRHAFTGPASSAGGRRRRPEPVAAVAGRRPPPAALPPGPRPPSPRDHHLQTEAACFASHQSQQRRIRPTLASRHPQLQAGPRRRRPQQRRRCRRSPCRPAAPAAGRRRRPAPGLSTSWARSCASWQSPRAQQSAGALHSSRPCQPECWWWTATVAAPAGRRQMPTTGCRAGC